MTIIISFSAFAAKKVVNVVSEERQVSSFHSVVIACNAKVSVTKGPTTSVMIRTDEDVMSAIKTEVKQGVLTISLSKFIPEITTLEVNILMQNINKLENNGNDSLFLTNTIDSDTLELSVNGSGNIKSSLKTNFALLKVNGNGLIEVTGDTENLEINVGLNGEVKALNINSKKSKIIIKGAGKCDLNVSDTLDINVGGFGGNGKIVYKGKPKLKINVIGAADISTLD
jgi:hypothetical protein